MYLFIEDKEFLELDVEENGKGGSATLARNLKGLWNRSSAIRKIASYQCGIKAGFMKSLATIAYWKGVALFGPAIANAALYIGGVAFMCAAVLGVGVAVLYLDKHRVFY